MAPLAEAPSISIRSGTEPTFRTTIIRRLGTRTGGVTVSTTRTIRTIPTTRGDPSSLFHLTAAAIRGLRLDKDVSSTGWGIRVFDRAGVRIVPRRHLELEMRRPAQAAVRPGPRVRPDLRARPDPPEGRCHLREPRAADRVRDEAPCRASRAGTAGPYDAGHLRSAGRCRR